MEERWGLGYPVWPPARGRGYPPMGVYPRTPVLGVGGRGRPRTRPAGLGHPLGIALRVSMVDEDEGVGMGAMDPRLSVRVAAAWRVILADCDGELSGMDLYEAHQRACVVFSIEPVAVGTFKNLLSRAAATGLIERVGIVPGYKRSVWMAGIFSLTREGEVYWEEHGDEDWGNGKEFGSGALGVGEESRKRMEAILVKLDAGKTVRLTVRDVARLGLASDQVIVMKLDQ